MPRGASRRLVRKSAVGTEADGMVADTEAALVKLRALTLRQEELQEAWHAGEWEDRYAVSHNTKAVNVLLNRSPEHVGFHVTA